MKAYGPNRVEELSGLVDTGATFSKVPITVCNELGLKARRKVTVKLSDQHGIERGVCNADAEINGVRDQIPITLGDESEESLIGYTTLEILGFKVNPITQKLEPTAPIEY